MPKWPKSTTEPEGNASASASAAAAAAATPAAAASSTNSVSNSTPTPTPAPAPSLAPPPRRPRTIDVMRMSAYEHALPNMEQMLRDRGYRIISSCRGLDRTKRQNPYYVGQNPTTQRHAVVFCDPGSLKIVELRHWLTNPWLADPEQASTVDLYIFLAAAHACGIKQALCQSNIQHYELWMFSQLVAIPHQHKLVPSFRVFLPDEAQHHFSAEILKNLTPMRTTDPYVRYFAYPVGTVLQEEDSLRTWIVAAISSS